MNKRAILPLVLSLSFLFLVSSAFSIWGLIFWDNWNRDDCGPYWYGGGPMVNCSSARGYVIINSTLGYGGLKRNVSLVGDFSTYHKVALPSVVNGNFNIRFFREDDYRIALAWIHKAGAHNLYSIMLYCGPDMVNATTGFHEEDPLLATFDPLWFNRTNGVFSLSFPNSTNVITSGYCSNDTVAKIEYYADTNMVAMIDDTKVYGEGGSPYYTCFDINSAGTYTLTNDIYADKEPCISINSSDVVLDLNGFMIQDTPYSETGIYVTAPSPENKLKNITIKNGRVDWFSHGIVFHYVDNSTLNNLDVTRNGYGIRLFYSDGINVTNSRITENQYGLRIDGLSKNHIVKDNFFVNVLKDYDISAGGLEYSYVIKNVFGNVTIDPACCTNKTIWLFGFGNVTTTTCVMPCSGTYSGASRVLDCYYCNRIDFVGNFYYGSVDDAIFRGSEYNRFIRDTFSRISTETKGLVLDATTQNNWGCDVQGYILDSGINNTFVANCPSGLYPNETVGMCIAGWKCIDGHTAGYQMTDCSWYRTITCPTNTICSNGACISINVTTPPPVIQPYEPQINTTVLGEAGVGWLAPFFTPIFFATLFLLGVSGLISKKIGEYAGEGKYGGLIFGISALILIVIFGAIGIYPAWLVIIIILLAGFIFAKIIGWV